MNPGDLVKHTKSKCKRSCISRERCGWRGCAGFVREAGKSLVLVEMLTTNKIWKRGALIKWPRVYLEVINQPDVTPDLSLTPCTSYMRNFERKLNNASKTGCKD